MVWLELIVEGQGFRVGTTLSRNLSLLGIYWGDILIGILPPNNGESNGKENGK